MAAYAAATTLVSNFSFQLNNMDVVLPSQQLEAFKIAYKELISFRNLVERLDIKSRKRMNASFQWIAEELRELVINSVNDGQAVAVQQGFMRAGILFKVQLKKVMEEDYTLLPEFVSKPKIVGFRDKWRLLKDNLIAPTAWFAPRNYYLLVGMAGIGKTALAREIFEDLDIMEWFDCRVWVTVGTEWKSEEITEAILAQVAPEAHKMIMGGSKEEIRDGLKESLKGKRYLIVLDDVWKVDVNEYLKTSLPDNKNGSCVLITSRLKYVFLGSTNNNFINMRLLDEEESWDLLREKTFDGGSCPPHLEKHGKKIVEKCDGLPLTILIVAEFLSKAEESIWIEAAVKKKHQLFINAYDQISKVLYPSYNVLHDEYKVCFLYMGAFLLKYEIPKSSLINLWIVEDFIEIEEGLQTLESSAAYLLEFLEWNSLIVCQRDITSTIIEFTGHVKSCRLHSTWWHFCQMKARETNLFLVLNCYDKDGIEEALEGHTRLSIHNNVLFALKHVHNSIEKICAFNVQTLLCFGPYCQYMVPICFGLKFLCRLDALNIRFYDFPLEVLKLVKLRYLTLTCNRSLPPSISVLQKLQYLIVHPHLSIKLHRAPSYLPIEIWYLEELNHLEVMGYDLPYFGEKTLQKLATLLDVTTSSCNVLNRFPNLRKLKITIELTPDVANLLCCFDQISILTKLESLKCAIVNPEWKFKVDGPAPAFPCLPLSLTKLSLSGLGYHWGEMSKIALLSNLKVLKLQCNAFQGSNWEVEKNRFPHLSSLLIEDVDLINLKWAPGSFKCLDVLRINHCFKLKRLYLGDRRLIHVEVIDCSPLVEWHVKRHYMELKHSPNISVRSSWRP